MKSKLIKLFFITTLILIQTLYAKETQKNNKTILQLQWKHQFQFAGYYIAKEKGFYKKLGLDVEIKEHKNGLDVVEEVVNNNATFATGWSSLVINKAKGDDIILLSAIFQSSPHILLALKESNIESVKDFKNKRIMMSGEAKNDLTFLGMMLSQQITKNDIQVQKHSYKLEDLVNKKTDLMASYISNEPFRLKEMYNLESKIFDPKDYGFDFYNDILFTRNSLAKKDPMFVKKFQEASIKGWEYAFENIEETADIILKKYNTQGKTKKALVFEGEELKKLAYYNTNKIGEIEKRKIEKIYDSYKLMGLVKSEINFEEFIFNFKIDSNLNEKEYNYLKNLKSISMCVDPDWMPYEKLDKNGNLKGLTKDYLQIFQNKLDDKIEIIKTKDWTETLIFMKEKKCDIISLAMKTKKREEHMDFTPPYLIVPLVLASKLTTAFVDDFNDLKNKKIGIVKSHAYNEIIRKRFPQIKIIDVKNSHDGLSKVEKEELFGFIGSVAEISHIIQKDYISELKISGKFDEKLNLSLAVNKDKPLLKSIFTKIINDIPESKKNEILQKHLSIKYEQRTDYSLFFRTLVFFTIVIILILIWLKTIKKQKDKVECLLEKLELAQEELKKSNKELKKLSETDTLTKTYNRVKIDRVLEKEIQRAKRFNRKFGIIIIDIDDFKKVNDTYGHQTGDLILIDFAKILKNNIRNVDTLGRWGGEEFFIICPETDLKGTLKLANNLRKKIENHAFPEVVSLTASLGVGCFEDEKSIKNLIKRTDNALYKAKEEGKNRVCTL